MDVHDNFRRNVMLNLFLFLAEGLFVYVESIVFQTISGNRAIQLTMEIFRKFQLLEADDTFVGLPIRFVAFATVFLSFVVPVVMFIAFGITSVIVTFAGFLFIEGTLLAFAGLCTCACIIILILVLSAFALTLGVFYALALKLGCFKEL